MQTILRSVWCSLGEILEFSIVSLKILPPKIPQLLSQWTAWWPWEASLSSHFHLPEIQQGTKYLWCFNPTCQYAGAFAFIYSALLSCTLHIWRPSITKSLWLHSRSPPVCLSCYKKQSCLTLSFSCPDWGETHSVCSHGQQHNDCCD